MKLSSGYLRPKDQTTGEYGIFLPITTGENVFMDDAGTPLPNIIAGIKTDHTGVLKSVEVISEDLRKALGLIAKVDGEVTTIDERSTKNETDIVNLATDITSITGEVVGLDSRAGSAESRLTRIEEQIEEGLSAGNSEFADLSEQARYLKILDTRSDNFGPFTHKGLSTHIKSNTADGLNDGGTFHGIIHFTHWDDISGGRPHQLGFTEHGNVYVRDNDGTSWTPWRPVNLVHRNANTPGFFDFTNTSPTGTTRMNYSGHFYATRIYNAVYNDYAEYFEKDEPLEPGDVVMTNPEGEGYVKSTYEDRGLVVGVVSDDYAHCIGGRGDGGDDEDFAPIGMAGRVRVKVTGDIKKGDLLIPSHIPGVGMKGKETGCIFAKALESHTGEEVHRIKALILNA